MVSLSYVSEIPLGRTLAFTARALGISTVPGSSLLLKTATDTIATPFGIVRGLITASGKTYLDGRNELEHAQIAQFVENFLEKQPENTLDSFESRMVNNSFVAGHSFTIADILAYYLVVDDYNSVNPKMRPSKYVATTRWMIQILNSTHANLFANVEGAPANPELPTPVALKNAFKATAPKPKKEKKAKAAPTPAEPEGSPLSQCDFRVGKIVEVWKHANADRLYCEKIDCGDPTGPREIASGLVPHFTLEEMQNRLVVVITNLKPRPLAGFMSHGMVLCATGEDGKVEFIEPPEGAKPGERITFEGHEGEPAEPNRMAKKKIFEAVAPKLVVNDDLVATWDGIPFQTSAGPCRVKSVKGGLIR